MIVTDLLGRRVRVAVEVWLPPNCNREGNIRAIYLVGYVLYVAIMLDSGQMLEIPINGTALLTP